MQEPGSYNQFLRISLWRPVLPLSGTQSASSLLCTLSSFRGVGGQLLQQRTCQMASANLHLTSNTFLHLCYFLLFFLPVSICIEIPQKLLRSILFWGIFIKRFVLIFLFYFYFTFKLEIIFHCFPLSKYEMWILLNNHTTQHSCLPSSL